MIHRLDPRLKILWVAGFSIVVALCSDWGALFFSLGISVIFVIVSRSSIAGAFSRMLKLNGLMLVFWLVLPFSYTGAPLIEMGPLSATREGVMVAALLTLRSNVIILASIVLMSTTTVFTMGFALRALRFPGKFVQLLFFTYRYLDVLQTEYQRLLKALKIRGFCPGSNLHTYKTYAYLIGILLVRSYDRSERIRSAMLLRGFNGRFYNLSEFTFGRSDMTALIVMTMALAGVLWLQW